MAPLPWPPKKELQLPGLPKPPPAFLAKVLEVAAHVNPQKVTKRLLDVADRSAAGTQGSAAAESGIPCSGASQGTVPRPKTPPTKPPMDEHQLKTMVDTVWRTMRGVKGAAREPSPQRRQQDGLGRAAAAALDPVKQAGVKIGRDGLTPIKQLGRTGAKDGRDTLERSKSFGLSGARLGKQAGNFGKQGLGAAGDAAKQFVHQVNDKLPVRNVVKSLSFPAQRKKAIPLAEAAIDLETGDATKEVARGSGTTDRGSSSTGTITPSGSVAREFASPPNERRFVEISDDCVSELPAPVEPLVALTPSMPATDGIVHVELKADLSRGSHSGEARRQEAEKWGLRAELAAPRRPAAYSIEE